YLAGGRTTEALPLLTAYADAHPADTDTLFAIVRLLYETHSAPGSDRARFLHYARSYVSASGPQQALVAQWIKALEGAKPLATGPPLGQGDRRDGVGPHLEGPRLGPFDLEHIGARREVLQA